MVKMLKYMESDASDIFRKETYEHNLICAFFITLFLAIQQLFYALIIHNFSNLIGQVHGFSALICALYALVFYVLQEERVKWPMKIREYIVFSFILFGFFVAILRSLLFPSTSFIVPVLYIALIYGFAFIFYYSPKVTFFVYLLSFFIMAYALPKVSPALVETTYLWDLASNIIIAWIASVINYRRFSRQVHIQELISVKNQELKYLSSVDMLTNIHNRRQMDENLLKAQWQSKTFSKPYAVIIADIDEFKKVNDTYGHHVGDQILVEFVKVFKNALRRSDELGRWGGEEFMIICSDTSSEEAMIIAEKLRGEVEKHDFKLDFQVTCSFGVAASENGENGYTLLSQADQALYQCKENGRNQVRIFEPFLSKKH